VTRPGGLRTAEKGERRSCSVPLGRNGPHGQPRIMVTAGEHGSNRAATRGRRCRLRLSGAIVGDADLRLAWACGRRRRGLLRRLARRKLGAREWKDPVGTR
jgi:hypothetical protein